MKNIVLKNYRLGLLIACLLLSPIYMYGQDLGSSSGLFKKKSATKPKKTTKKKTTKRKKTTTKKRRSTSKRKTTAAKKRTTKKRSTRSSRTSRRKSSTARNKVRTRKKSTKTAKKIVKPNDVVINVGEVSNEEKAELLEQAIAEGNIARNLRQYVKAEESYTLAKSFNSTDSRAVYGLGNIYSDQQRWEEAEQAYRNAIKIEPDNPSAHIAISFVLTQPVVGSNIGERYVEAEKMARRAIELDPNNAIGYDQLGVSLELRGFIGDETEKRLSKGN